MSIEFRSRDDQHRIILPVELLIFRSDLFIKYDRYQFKLG